MTDGAQLVWTAWSLEPSIWLGMALLVAAYFAAGSVWRVPFKHAAPVSRSQRVWFLLGAFIMWFALVSPMDEISDHYLFSMHMVQHILLTLVAPPLMLVGTPGWMLEPLVRFKPLRRVLRVLTMPVLAFAIFNLDFAVWHVPMFYEATLETQTVHIVEHLLFIGTGFLNWWAILSPLPELPRLPYPAQILYLFLDAVPSTVLGAIFIFGTVVLYPIYAAAPRLFGISALDDQLFAGLIMAMPGAMIYLAALSVVFFQWVGGEERAESGQAVVR